MLTNKWQRVWVYLLQQNEDYSLYCRARAKKDRATCLKMEKAFPFVAELYADWGDVAGISTKAGAEDFAVWAKERYELFYGLRTVRWIEKPASYQHTAGHMLVDIPIQQKKAETVKALLSFVDFHYKMKGRVAVESKIEAARIASLPMVEPKYSLHGDFNKATQGAVMKAVYVNAFKRIAVNGKALSQTDTVIAIMQDAKNPLGWVMSANDKAAHAAGVFKKSLFNSAKVKLLARHRKDFEALVRNTIHGRFPDFR